MKKPEATVDLRTAQNSMFPFVTESLAEAEDSGKIKSLMDNPEALSELYIDVHRLIFNLLAVPQTKRTDWHFGVIDSGKRAIEALVSYFCPAQKNANILVNTENYVAFNKFSAAKALHEQKGVEFVKPFNLAMGQALTVDSEAELSKVKKILQQNNAATLWIAWNSTSTGVKEKLEDLVDFRNKCNSSTLIISDAASLPLFTESWKNIHSDRLPDIFFFSLRKQALPYDGPQDEANQAKNSGSIYLFNNKALKLADRVNGVSLYDTPRPADAAQFTITPGEQRENHIRHLLKLQVSIATFMADNGSKLKACDSKRLEIQKRVHQAFADDGKLALLGFRLLADSNAQSETAYIVRVPENVKPSSVVNSMKDQGIQISVSMHPEVPNSSYFRFACYPATRIEETEKALAAFGNFVLN